MLKSVHFDAIQRQRARQKIGGCVHFLFVGSSGGGEFFRNGKALEFASEELQADREVVLAAVALASEELRADREVVLAAVERSGLALHGASEELPADRDICIDCRAAWKKCGYTSKVMYHFFTFKTKQKHQLSN